MSNVASGIFSSVTAGSTNTAGGDYSAVSGGQGSTADQEYEVLGDSFTKPRFVDNGDGTVTDKHTGLQWQKDTDPTNRTWDDSYFYCETLALAGHSDWRMPSLEDLRSIVDETRLNPAIDPAFGAFSGVYWSSSTDAVNPIDAWFVFFSFGSVFFDGRGSSFYVRAVRSGP